MVIFIFKCLAYYNSKIIIFNIPNNRFNFNKIGEVVQVIKI